MREYESTPEDKGAVMTNKRERRMQRSAAAFAAARASASQKSGSSKEGNTFGSPP